MPKVWVLLLVESSLLVLLALQVFGGTKAEATAGNADGVSPAQRGASAEQVTGAADAASKAKEPSPTVQRSVATATWSKDDPVGILLTGTIRGSDGSLVKDAGLYFNQDSKGHSASTGKDGSYAVTALEPGEWTFRFRAEGFASQEGKHALSDEAIQHFDLVVDPAFPVRVRIETTDGKDANAELAMQAGQFFGFHVIGSKEPIPDHLALTDYAVVFVGDANWRRDEKRKDGVAGVLEFAKPLPGYAAVMLRHLVLAQQRVEAGQQEVKFVLDPADVKSKLATVTLRVVDEESSSPLAGVTCGLRSSSGGGAHGKSDDDGRMTITGALPGLLIMEMQAKDHERFTTKIRVTPGETRDLGEFRLGKLLKIIGHVFDAAGKPASAEIQWTELKWRREPAGFVHNRSATADAEGRFELWGGSGRHAITARGPDDSIAVGVFDSSSTVPIELHLAPPAEVVLLRDSDPTKGFVVTLFDPQKQPVGAWELHHRSTTYPTKLPAGDYGYEVTDDANRVVRSGTVTLGATKVVVDLR